MAEPWSAEFVVSHDLARSLIEAQFPQLAPTHVEPFGAGWDNTAFRVNKRYVFRFPRRQVIVPLFEIETRVLPAIAPRLPLPVPTPRFVGRPTDAYPWPFAGYPLLHGRTACGAALDDAQRLALAAPLARFVAALHAIPAADACQAGAGGDTIGRLDITDRQSKARDLLDRLTREGLVDSARLFADVLDAAPVDYTPRADTLVHGDLYARHLLVDAEGRLAGVIDWGDVHVGDPAVDLAAAHGFLPPAARGAFRDAYGPIEEIAWRVARFRALWHTLNVVAYAHRTADADLLSEGRAALRHLAVDG